MPGVSSSNVSYFALPAEAVVGAGGLGKAVRAVSNGLAGTLSSGRVVRLSPARPAIVAAPTARPVNADGSPAEQLARTSLSLGAIASGDTLIGNASYSYQDATSQFEQIWAIPPGRPPHRYSFDSCASYHKREFEPSGFEDNGDEYIYDRAVYGAQGEELDLTETPDIYKADIQWPDRGAWAPYAFKVQNGRCEYFGRAVMYGSRGDYAVGYREYHGPYLSAPSVANGNVAKRDVAVRWHGKQLSELGSGVALDVTDDGTAVGTDTYSEDGLGHKPFVHARLWSSSGAVTPIATDATASIAHAIDARHRVAGVLVRGDRAYAFLWQDGSTRTLDDIVHDANWHFEAAFDFSPDGRIAGSGTYRGNPGLFLVRIP